MAKKEVEIFEPKRGWAKGTQGRAAFDGDFVIIERKGMGARLTVGKGTKRIPISSISAVQVKPAGALVNGFIQFTIAGGVERRSAFGQQTTSAVGDENSIVFTKAQQPSFEALRRDVEQEIAERSRPRPTQPAAPDVLAQLRQLGELRDAGVVTPEEFEAKKADLLRRL